MPISGLVIRFAPAGAVDSVAVRQGLAAIDQLELGAFAAHGVSAVLEAADYAAHDAALEQVQAIDGVAAVDLVFHDFSDVGEFGRLPRRQAGARR